MGVAHSHDLLATKWQEATEAAHFAEIMQASGVNQDRLYIEDRATNTGENAALSYELLTSKNIQPKSILIVTKPYMERRALATFQAQWPDRAVNMHVCSTGQTIDDYCNDEQSFDTVLNIMVGDFERIIEYPKHRLSELQAIPTEVMNAFDILKRSGYVKHSLER